MQWDSRLITPARAMELAGDHGIYASIGYAQLSQFGREDGAPAQPSRWQVNLRCGPCHQSVIQLATMDVEPGSTLIRSVNYDAVTPAELLTAVLRHLVMAHDVSLSGGEADAAAGSAVPDGDRVRGSQDQNGSGGAPDGAAGLPWLRH